MFQRGLHLLNRVVLKAGVFGICVLNASTAFANMEVCQDFSSATYNVVGCEKWFDISLLIPDNSLPVILAHENHIDDTGFLLAINNSPSTKNASHFLDRHRIYFTEQVKDITNALDRFISQKERVAGQPSESYFILNTEIVLNEYGDNSYSVTGSGKADLSNTEKHLKFIFESRPEEDQSLRENERPNRTPAQGLDGDDAIAGFQFAEKRGEFDWRSSFDLGARLNFPMDAFARYKLVKKTKLGKSFLTSRAELPYFVNQGAKPSAKVSWLYPINERLHFRSVSRYKYTRQTHFDEWSQSLQLNHYVNDNVGVEYKVGASGDEEYHDVFSVYYIQAGFKLNMYNHWIYLSIVPAFEFAEENDWEADFSLGFFIQAIYSD